jgi:hypothetical protein
VENQIMSRARLAEELKRLLPSEKDKRIRQAILTAFNGSAGLTQRLRTDIDQSNRTANGILNDGTVTITGSNATLDLFVWSIAFEVFQPGPVTLPINPPDSTFVRVDYFHGDATGSILYTPGLIDAQGNSLFPSIPPDHIILSRLIRNVDGSNTTVPVPPIEPIQFPAIDGKLYGVRDQEWEEIQIQATSDSNKVSYNQADNKNATDRAQARSNIGSTSNNNPQIISGLSGTVNNLILVNNSVVITNLLNDIIVTGLNLDSTHGEEIVLFNNSNGQNIILISNSSLSTSGNRIQGGPYILRPKSGVKLKRMSDPNLSGNLGWYVLNSPRLINKNDSHLGNNNFVKLRLPIVRTRWDQIAYGQGYYVCISAPQSGDTVFSETAFRTKDFVNFDPIQGLRAGDPFSNRESLIHTGSAFINLFPLIGGTTGNLSRSIDKGLTWHEIITPWSGILVGDIASHKGRTIIVLRGGTTAQPKIYYSDDDGNSWTASIVNTSLNIAWSRIATNGKGVWVAGNTGSSTGRLARSIDNGVTWDVINLQLALSRRQLFWAGDRFIFGSNERSFDMSFDGVSWIHNDEFDTFMNSNDFNISSFLTLTYNQGTFYAFERSSNLIFSTSNFKDYSVSEVNSMLDNQYLEVLSISQITSVNNNVFLSSSREIFGSGNFGQISKKGNNDLIEEFIRLAGKINNLDINFNTELIILENATEITGISGGRSGRIVFLYNENETVPINIPNNSVDSDQLNRFKLISNESIAPLSGKKFFYTGQRWRPLF